MVNINNGVATTWMPKKNKRINMVISTQRDVIVFYTVPNAFHRVIAIEKS